MDVPEKLTINALAEADIAHQYNEALDESPTVEALIKKLRL